MKMAERTHITFAASTTAITAFLIAAGMAAGQAQAQETRGVVASQVSSSLEPVPVAANVGERMETADCRTGAGVEVAPVSFDEMNAPQAWVIVERAGGEPVSATRIDPDDTVLIKSIRCGDNDWVRPGDAPAGS